jgi:hypothetical protein
MFMTKTSRGIVSDTRQTDLAKCFLCTQGLEPIVFALYVCCKFRSAHCSIESGHTYLLCFHKHMVNTRLNSDKFFSYRCTRMF